MIIKSGWQKIDGNNYYFDNNGFMYSNGRRTIDGKTYVFTEDGKRLANQWYEESYIMTDYEGNKTKKSNWYY